MFTEAFSLLLRLFITNQDQKECRVLHRLARKCGLDSDPFLGTCLVRMYSVFESLTEAKKAFRRISEPNVFTWNAYISAFANTGHLLQVMSIYHEMRNSGVSPNKFVLVSVLKACCTEGDLMEVHSYVLYVGLEAEDFIGSTLIDMYSRYGRLDDALAVFRGMSSTQNVVPWSTLITGFAQQNQPEVALSIFTHMQEEGLQPNQFTCVALLKACSKLGAAGEGRLIHSQIVENGFEMNKFVGSALVDMYARNGDLDDALVTMHKMDTLNVVAWSALVSGYAQHGHCQEALELFSKGLKKGMVPDNVALSAILLLCPSVAAFQQGLITHMHAIEGELANDLFVGSALVGLYAQSGSLKDACIVFELLHHRNVWTWSAIILGCAQHNNFSLAVKYFEDMLEGGIEPNSLTFVALLSACNYEGLMNEGFEYFKLMHRRPDTMVMPEHFHTMVDLLGQAGRLDHAEDLLETLHFQSEADGWRSLLRICYKRGIVRLGRRCFNRLSSLEVADCDYVMMSSIYVQACIPSEAKRIEEKRTVADLPNEVPTAYIEVDKQVHAFSAGLLHPQKEEILSKLLHLGISHHQVANRAGSSDVYVDNEDPALRTDTLCGHVERLAVAFGLLSSSQDTVVRISKTPRMCIACHNAMKAVSKTQACEIVVFVENRVHRFQEGACCCKDKF